MKSLLQISDRVGNFRFWRFVVNFWTVVFFVAIIFDFFRDNILAESDIMIAVAAIYCAALAIYSAEKEFRRWQEMHSSLHPGEVYALLWTVLVILLIIGQSVLHFTYRMPPEVSASYIAVISILALTRESKNMHKRKSKGRSQ